MVNLFVPTQNQFGMQMNYILLKKQEKLFTIGSIIGGSGFVSDEFTQRTLLGLLILGELLQNHISIFLVQI